MSDFTKAYDKTSANEGEYANNPADTGGQTYRGISRNNWPKWGGWKYVDGAIDQMVKPPTYDTSEYYHWVKFLNKQLNAVTALQIMVKAFYEANFWKRLGEINDQDLAEWIYDRDVNTGSRGSRWLQESVYGKVDGEMGTKTIAAANNSDAFTVLERMKTLATDYYLHLAQQPHQGQFWHSWIGRVGLSPEKLAQANSRAHALGILA